MDRSDSELVEAACSGDLASFRILYERHYRMALGIARSRLSDRHLAEDAAQEAFAAACRRLSTLRDGRRFAEWLGTICRRTASRMARSRAKHRPIHPATVSTSPDNGNSDDTVRVQDALAKLSASGRDVIMLHYFSELSYDEISQALGITRQSVHGRLQRARSALMRDLHEQAD